MYNELTINLGTNQTISLNLFDPQNQIIKSRDFEVSLQFIQIPGYMTYTKFFDDEEHAPIKIYDNIEINANGTMNLK